MSDLVEVLPPCWRWAGLPIIARGRMLQELVPRCVLPSGPTNRELPVDGLTNREVALRLVVERDAVKDHVHSIIKKLGAADRTHAAVIAVRGGIVS